MKFYLSTEQLTTETPVITKAITAFSLVLGLTACTSTPSKPPMLASMASYTDCDKDPAGTSSAITWPGHEAVQEFGFAKKEPNGTLRWMAKITLEQEKDKDVLSVSADGFGFDLSYAKVPGPNARNMLFRNIVNPGRVEATTGDFFDTQNPLNPGNKVTLTWHCENSLPTPSIPSQPVSITPTTSAPQATRAL
jgi:hypothetical protein